MIREDNIKAIYNIYSAMEFLESDINPLTLNESKEVLFKKEDYKNYKEMLKRRNMKDSFSSLFYYLNDELNLCDDDVINTILESDKKNLYDIDFIEDREPEEEYWIIKKLDDNDIKPEKIIEDYDRNEAIGIILKNGCFSWETDNQISLNGTNIKLNVIDN